MDPTTINENVDPAVINYEKMVGEKLNQADIDAVKEFFTGERPPRIEVVCDVCNERSETMKEIVEILNGLDDVDLKDRLADLKGLIGVHNLCEKLKESGVLDNGGERITEPTALAFSPSDDGNAPHSVTGCFVPDEPALDEGFLLRGLRGLCGVLHRLKGTYSPAPDDENSEVFQESIDCAEGLYNYIKGSFGYEDE